MSYILTSVSGNPISAVSAGFSPTNSADVSAIASAYQVVSSTATQLHAGTAYLTSVNEAPISASRAGQAANASLANSAYYDGTGRLISALPDSAAVSAIASSYAESAASGKQDELTFGYDANNLISSIDGSALAGQGGGGGGSVESPYGTIIVTDGTAIEGTNSAIGIVPGSPEKFLNLAPSSPQINYWYSNVLMGGQSASGASLMRLKALEYTSNPAMLFTVSIRGNPIGGGGEIVGTASATAYGSSMRFDFPLDPSWGFGTIWASANPSTIDLDTADNTTLAFYSATTATGVKELAWKDELPTYQYDGGGKISAINGSAIGGMDEAAVSGIASAYAESAASGKLDATAFNSGDFYSTGNPSGFVDSKWVESGFYTTANESGFVDSAYVDSAVSGKMDSSASSSFYTTANESGFVDSAYVESSVSSKLDTTAFNSGDFYSTGNPSGFVDSVYVESSVSGKQDASAMSSYALSSDVSGTVDLVSSQSANWGGSALQLSAGDGISLTMSGNILIISTASA